MDSHPRLGRYHAIILNLSMVLLASTLLVGFLWMRSDFLVLVLVTAPLSIPGGFLGGLIGGYGARNRFRRQHQVDTATFLDKNSRLGYLAFWSWVGSFSGVPLGIMTFQGAIWIADYFAIFDSLLINLFIFVGAFLWIAVIPGTVVFLTVMAMDWNIRPWFKDRKILYTLIATNIFLLLCLSTIGFTLQAYNFYFSILEDAYAFAPKNPEWFLLPKPPAEVVQLVSIRPFTIFVETIDEKIFGCMQTSKLDSTCWHEVNSLPDEPEALCEISNEFPEPPQPNKIVQKLQKEYCEYGLGGEYNLASFQYLLTENGEVWQWGMDQIGLVETPEFDMARGEVVRKAHWLGFVFGCILTSLVIFLAILARWIVQKREIGVLDHAKKR